MINLEFTIGLSLKKMDLLNTSHTFNFIKKEKRTFFFKLSDISSMVNDEQYKSLQMATGTAHFILKSYITNLNLKTYIRLSVGMETTTLPQKE